MKCKHLIHWTAISLLILLHHAQAIKWLSIRVPVQSNWNVSDCKDPKNSLLSKQQKICRRFPKIMPYISEAVQTTLSECQKLFEYRRWNCSTAKRAPKFMNDLTTGTREESFLYSLAAAAVVFSVTRACSIGNLEFCSCGKPPRTQLKESTWTWGNCNDNIGYGTRFGKNFLDFEVKAEVSKGRDSKVFARKLMTLHNNEVGRQTVRDKMETVCKCLGVSGACTRKTCFRRLGNFSIVSAELQKKYDKAVSVTLKPGRKGRSKTKLVRKNTRKSDSYRKRDLIFLRSFKNYCRKSVKRGSLGTKGRKCKAKSKGAGSCRELCCRRGYITRTEEIEERCQCKYVWCCYVKCKTCKKKVKVHLCK